MVDDGKIEIIKPEMIPLDRLHPNPWNPNVQDEETFNQLVEEIRADGFEHPLNVVPCTCDEIDGEHWMIIGGEHRFKAATFLEMEAVPCCVANWDELEAKFKTVKRNLLTGELSATKFTALVKSLEDRVDPGAMPHAFGFSSEKEFKRFLIEEKDDRDRSFMDSLLDETRKGKFAVDSISDIISTIFGECAETVDQNFLFFTYRGAIQCVCLCDDACLKSVKNMVQHLKDTGGDITVFMQEAIDARLEG